jgi:hypothetical protein
MVLEKWEVFTEVCSLISVVKFSAQTAVYILTHPWRYERRCVGGYVRLNVGICVGISL